MSLTALGNESPEMYEKAEELLTNDKSISFVGRGDSLEPIIPDGSTLIISPFQKWFNLHKDVKQGDTLMVRDYIWVGKGRRKQRVKVIHTHMVWMVKDHHALIGTSMGQMHGWIHENDILGKCIAITLPGVTDDVLANSAH